MKLRTVNEIQNIVITYENEMKKYYDKNRDIDHTEELAKDNEVKRLILDTTVLMGNNPANDDYFINAEEGFISSVYDRVADILIDMLYEDSLEYYVDATVEEMINWEPNQFFEQALEYFDDEDFIFLEWSEAQQYIEEVHIDEPCR